MPIVRRGPIQRRIVRAFIAKPGAVLSTADLVHTVYPRLAAADLKRSHWAVVRRAAERVAERVGRKRPGGLVWAAKSAL